MPRNVWHYRVDLKGVWKNEDMTFEQRRDAIVTRLKASYWFNSRPEDSILPELVEELQDVEDVPSFDGVFSCIYDEADADRCWIATF